MVSVCGKSAPRVHRRRPSSVVETVLRLWTRPGPTSPAKRRPLGRDWSEQRLSERFGAFVRVPAAVEVARGQPHAYVERPLQRARDDGLWREYQDALGAARTRRGEARDVWSSKVDAARASHRRPFKLRPRAIDAMPVSRTDKRKLYRMLAFEKRAAERGLEIASVNEERFFAAVRSCSPSSTSFFEKGMVRLWVAVLTTRLRAKHEPQTSQTSSDSAASNAQSL